MFVCAIPRTTYVVSHLINKKFIVRRQESKTSRKGKKMCIFNVFHESSKNDYSFIIYAIYILTTSTHASF